MTPTLETEVVKRRRASATESAVLKIHDQAVFELSRVRSIDGRKIIREIAIVPAALFPGMADRSPLPNALYALYQQSYGIVISRAAEELHAVLASAEDAALMDVEVGSPLVEVRRKAIDISERVVEIRLSRYVTDDLHYDVVLN